MEEDERRKLDVDERRELEELRAEAFWHRRVRFTACAFAEQINEHRAHFREKSTVADADEMRGEWKIVASALSFAASHGTIHEGIASLLKNTLSNILNGNLPDEFKPPARRPNNSYLRKEWLAAVQFYAAAAELGHVPDRNYNQTIQDYFSITDRTRQRWLGNEGVRRLVQDIMTLQLSRYTEPGATEALPIRLSPNGLRKNLEEAASAYRNRRRDKR